MPGPLPLLALRAFAEAGRHGSVKAAAAALGVTPGAVSQQIKALERRLGTTLFERRNREIRLTPSGVALLEPIAEAFTRIGDAVESFERRRIRRQRTLSVSTMAAFAASWLVPRLGRFAALHPEIEIKLHTSADLVPVGAGPGHADVAIRHGLGQYPGLRAVKLLQPLLVPVGSPALLAAGPPIRAPADCLAHPLLQDADSAGWMLWLRALGVADPGSRAVSGPSFADDALMVRAAVAAQGLALVRDAYVADEIATGRLVLALDAPSPAQFAYYIVTRPEAAAHRPQVAAFTDWLLAEAATAEPMAA